MGTITNLQNGSNDAVSCCLHLSVKQPWNLRRNAGGTERAESLIVRWQRRQIPGVFSFRIMRRNDEAPWIALLVLIDFACCSTGLQGFADPDETEVSFPV